MVRPDFATLCQTSFHLRQPTSLMASARPARPLSREKSTLLPPIRLMQRLHNERLRVNCGERVLPI